MTDKHGDENLPVEAGSDSGDEGHTGDRVSEPSVTEPDLRSIMGAPGSGIARAPVHRTLPPELEQTGPPESGPLERPAQPTEERRPSPQQGPLGSRRDEDLPPIWPGDEKQEWFRRERGLPPLPTKSEQPAFNPEDLPSPLADIPTRARAFGVGFVLPRAISMFTLIGLYMTFIIFLIDLLLYRRGQDVGAVIFRLRVVRENGDVAGFYTMWVRSMASVISLLAFGAGYWTAFADPHFRTWHDKWLGTYVVKDTEEYETRKRSNSASAFNWFWVTLFIVVALAVLVRFTGAPVTDTPVTDVPGTETPSAQ